MTEPQIDFYDVKTGWSTIPDPLADGTEEGLRTAGFNLFAQAGIEGGSRIIVYRGSGQRFLIFVDGIDSSVETIMAADFPSMIELTYKLSPMALASQVQTLQDAAEDLQELLVGEHGPLQDAYEARWRRRRAEVEAAKQRPKTG
jgi:hypothetical protein